jgi:NADH-quinone oxidoreductase subunit M
MVLPVIGALAIWTQAGGGRSLARQVALETTLAVFVLAAIIIYGYGPGTDAKTPYAATDFSWLGAPLSSIDIRFSVALDGLSLWLFGLTALLMITAVLVSWRAITDRAPAFYAMLLLLETGMLGVFTARDIILFYIFFEATLIPLFFLIGIWGSEERRYAAIKFFLFTFAGSVLTFLGLLAIVLWNQAHDPRGVMTFSISDLTAGLALSPISPGLQLWIFLALFAGFAIKVPLVPLHTWLPLAHVQAPTAGSVILAGVLLKIGTYGFLRFCLPMLPAATAAAMPWILWLSVAGILYGGLLALAQSDMKRLVAYSSVSHLGFCMLGFFAVNRLGVEGGTLQMINHGLSTGGLFALVGMLYERYHTRQIKELGGLARRTPVLAAFMVLFTLSSIGLPGLNGFAGEFLLLLGMFQRAWVDAPTEFQLQWKIIAVGSVSGVVLGAWYMLWLVQRVFFGPLREPSHGPDEPPVCDMSLREILALAPLVVFIFWIGVQPGFFLDRMSPTLRDLTASAQERVEGRGPAVGDQVVWEGEAYQEREAPAEPQERGQGSGVRGQGAGEDTLARRAREGVRAASWRRDAPAAPQARVQGAEVSGRLPAHLLTPNS